MTATVTPLPLYGSGGVRFMTGADPPKAKTGAHLPARTPRAGKKGSAHESASAPAAIMNG